jgi:glyoxylase-like metal-dependent hydrolase (beta-lactamase superfamily II)
MKSILSFLILFITLHVSAQKEELKLIDFGTNLYAIENSKGGNIAFLVTRKGVVVVDAGATPNNGKKIISLIKSVTRKPIKYLILTHVHSDHINGISAYPKEVQIIAHANLEKNNFEFNEQQLKKYKESILPNYIDNLRLQIDSFKNKESEEYQTLIKEYNTNIDYFEDIKQIKFRKPDITFTDFYRLKIADERIVLEHPGPGHTFNNVVVKFSFHNVIHTGDLVFNKSFPYTIEEHGVDIYNWVKILDDLYKENIYTLIPGHGEVGEKIIIKEQSDYFKQLAQKVERLKKQDLNLDQIIEKCDPKDYNFDENEDQLPVNIKIIYSQMVNTKIEWWKF